MTIIKSGKITLRPIRLSDARAYFESQSDLVARKMFMTTPKNVKEAAGGLKDGIREMKSKNPTVEAFTIEVDGKPAGFKSIREIDYGHERHKASISYGIHREFRGKGIGTKALKLVTAYAFKKYNLKRLWAYTRTYNKASACTLEKAGYKLEGVLKKNKYKQGRYVDDMLWAKVQ